VPHFLSHGHGPGGTGANSTLYSPLGKMHDEVSYYRARRESRLVPADAINTPARVDLGRLHQDGPSIGQSRHCRCL
jgi:hypothetical protein